MTDVEPLTLDRAVELAREVVAEKGADFVYEEEEGAWGGLYVHAGDKPGCLVGHILLRHGVPVETLKNYNSMGIAWVADETGVAAAEATNFLESVQGDQDDGHSWGKAVDEAARWRVPSGDDDA